MCMLFRPCSLLSHLFVYYVERHMYATECFWMSENELQELAVYYCMGSGDVTQVVRHADEDPLPLSQCSNAHL